MATTRILLCCGAGFSSGLLAQQSRKYAKKAKLDVTVEARSESQVSGYLDKTDVLLLGPHYANELDGFRAMVEGHGIEVAVIPEDIYGSIDGERLVKFALELAGKE